MVKLYILSCLETLFSSSLRGISMYGDGLTECTLQIVSDNKSKQHQQLPPGVSELVLIIVLSCQALTDAPTPHCHPWPSLAAVQDIYMRKSREPRVSIMTRQARYQQQQQQQQQQQLGLLTLNVGSFLNIIVDLIYSY